MLYCLTTQQIGISRNNFVIENRAWIGYEYQPDIYKNSPWGFNIVIKNFGKTPATQMQVWKGGFLSYERNLQIPKIKLWETATLSPNATYPIDIPLDNYGDFNDNSLSAMIPQGKIFLYYRFVIVYKDIYGQSDTTEFIFRGKTNMTAETIYSKMK